LAGALSALDALPGKFRDAEAGFGGAIGQSASELAASAQRMNKALGQGQSSLAATLAAFEAKVGAIPQNLSAATQQSAQAMQAALRETLDGAAASATEASRASGEIMSARMGEVSASLGAVAALLAQAGQNSHTQMAEGARRLTESSESSAARLSATIDSFSLAVSRLSARLDQVEHGLDAQNLRLAKAGEIVAGASNNLAQAANAMESAATPLTTASLSFQGAMARFSEAAGQIQQISASGDAIAAHIAGFGTQMTHSLAAFDALPEKIRATESGFGGEIGRTAGQLTDAALRMSASFERGQSALAETLASFETKIAAIPSSLASATEKTSQEIGDKVRKALDDAASVASQASRSSADIMASRVGEIAHSLSAAALKLQAASEASGAHMQASGGHMAQGVAEGVKIIADTAENSAARLSHTVETFAAAVLGLSSKLGEVVGGLDAQNLRLEKAGAVVSGASNSLAQAAGSVANATTPLTKATVSFQGAMETFACAAEQIRAISDSGRGVAESFERTAQAADRALGAHADNFRDVERSVAQTLSELVRGVQSLGFEITQCIETYDNEIAKSIGSLEAALIDLGDIVDDRAKKRQAAERR
jgi:ABC-type transporter Mla subunit MlaD